MKILAIRGKNLASLEGTFEIDFRTEPLRSAGIFAITGTTGSGKSTILDAMCIALYDTSPRLESVRNSTYIEKKGSKSVSENSPKTILRRGSHEGWAEVDFLSVNGHEYRVRWSVSRTNNSPDGTFRETSYDLTDLTTGEYSPLTSKSHKQAIPALTGLTFEQFTRAVLLAQGNFAAFLKADESEKASILETLSGTEIYSLISAEIYRRYSESKRELDALEEKKKGIEMLSAEELAAISEEKKRMQLLYDGYEKENNGLLAKIEWIKRHEQLALDLSAAESELEKAKENVLSIVPVKEKLGRIDSVQDIRDSYVALQGVTGLIKEDEQLSSMLNESLCIKKKEHEEILKQLDAARKEQDDAGALAAAMQPKIIEAGRVENVVLMVEKKFSELNDGINKATKEREECMRNIKACRARLAELEVEENELDGWFKRNSAFEQAEPMFPSVVANIVASRDETELIDGKKRSLEVAEALLKEHDGQLQRAVEKEEVLKKTLSSEIATLRSRLVEGEPCPVCGSRKHEVPEVALDILEEKELEKAKETNRLLIEHLKENISNRKSEIDKLQSAIEIHRQTVGNYHKKNMEYLASVQGAADILSRSDVAEFLTTLSRSFAKNRERLVNINNEKHVNANSAEILEKRLLEIETDLHEKSDAEKRIAAELETAKRQLVELRGTFPSAEKMQEHCNRVVADANEKFSRAVEKRNLSVVAYKKIEGSIADNENRLKNNRNRRGELQQVVDDYIASHKELTAETVAALVAIDAATVANMRRMVEQAGNNLSSATAKVTERRRNMAEHELLPAKPAKDESRQLLNEALSENKEKQNGIFKEISRIAATILKDEENNRLFSNYKEEYDRRKKVTAKWNSLNLFLGSQKGDKLMRLVQGYTLDILLGVANEHLKSIAPRYSLMRIAHDKLAIKVIDLDMMSAARSVHSLSGGETFLVSLALSLALSSISSNRMSIETLFIDEGFGALDSETLKIAMHALEGLQSQGRKIGVISHLSEMLEQIPVKINVVKKGLGRSRVEIGQ